MSELYYPWVSSEGGRGGKCPSSRELTSRLIVDRELEIRKSEFKLRESRWTKRIGWVERQMKGYNYTGWSLIIGHIIKRNN